VIGKHDLPPTTWHQTGQRHASTLQPATRRVGPGLGREGGVAGPVPATGTLHWVNVSGVRTFELRQRPQRCAGHEDTRQRRPPLCCSPGTARRALRGPPLCTGIPLRHGTPSLPRHRPTHGAPPGTPATRVYLGCVAWTSRPNRRPTLLLKRAANRTSTCLGLVGRMASPASGGDAVVMHLVQLFPHLDRDLISVREAPRCEICRPSRTVRGVCIPPTHQPQASSLRGTREELKMPCGRAGRGDGECRLR
jgi:hypothetical protein